MSKTIGTTCKLKPLALMQLDMSRELENCEASNIEYYMKHKVVYLRQLVTWLRKKPSNTTYKQLYDYFMKKELVLTVIAQTIALLELDMNGELDKYQEVFDIKHYQYKKIGYFCRLIKKFEKKPNNALFNKLYYYFLEKEPELMKKAEEKVQIDSVKKLLPSF